MARSSADAIAKVEAASLKKGNVVFRPGDTVRVHAKIIEGQRERVQVFEGVVLKKRGSGVGLTFTVRKVSFNVGVERTFLLHSPRIEKIELVSRGSVRRARLFYLRELRGKAARIKSELVSGEESTGASESPADDEPSPSGDPAATEETATA